MTIASGTWGDDGTWRLEDDGTLYVEGTGAMEDYESASNTPWYSNKSSILAVVIGEGITYIGDFTFYDIYSIKSVKFPDTLERIGRTGSQYGPFRACKGITELVLPKNLTFIGDYCFYESSIMSVDFGNVESIGKYAFKGCPLFSVNLKNVQTIADYAFTGCPLRRIELSEGLTSIGSYAFQNHWCHGIIVPSTVTSIGANAFNPLSNTYKKHMTIVFRGEYISGTYGSFPYIMIHVFCKNDDETYTGDDYTNQKVNSSHPVMIRVPGGWRVISPDIIDRY